MILQGDCLQVLSTMDEKTIQTCVTSPPYFGLRDYGHAGQIGLEDTPEAYVEKLVAVFREVRRVLKDDGVLWLNLGDSYWGNYISADSAAGLRSDSLNPREQMTKKDTRRKMGDLKPKDLIGIPWMVAFALRADGWYLRSDIIWHKPNPMPESVTDRPTKSHEYIFLMSKSATYYYDAAAIAETVTDSTIDRLTQPTLGQQEGSSRVPGKTNGNMKAVGQAYSFARKVKESPKPGTPNQHREDREDVEYRGKRNKRTVWTVTTKPYKGAHFATFPPDLIEPCILAGSRVGDIVLDPFNGSGTTGSVAIKHHRDYIGIELNPDYIALSNKRLTQTQPVLMGVG